MKYRKRLDKLWQQAPRLSYDDSSKIVMISDCHRGNGGSADQFSANAHLYNAALDYYFREGYTYIELGDGDELWAFPQMRDIVTIQLSTFIKIRKFYQQGRLQMLYGNHDIVKRKKGWVEANLARYQKPNSSLTSPLLPKLQMQEGLLLSHQTRGQEQLLLLHGHQVDFWNSTLWPLCRFLVRHLWRPLELIGIKDPVSPSVSQRKSSKVEQYLSQYCRELQRPLIAGHTHKCWLPSPGQTAYFNDGCCVHPHHITALTIDEGQIALVKWATKTRDDGSLYVGHSYLAGPFVLQDFFG